MVHPFLRRRNGEEPVVYMHPALEEVLGETLGVVLWQEQVLEVTHALTGMSRGKGERLRRALSKNSPDLERLSHLFWNGARARGVAEDITHMVWEQLKALGGIRSPRVMLLPLRCSSIGVPDSRSITPQRSIRHS
jgi:error-prone DNA polymerase